MPTYQELLDQNAAAQAILKYHGEERQERTPVASVR